MKHRLSSGVIVEQDGRVLLAHCVKPGRYDFWVAPGGGVKGTESLVDAASREAFEETGLNVNAGRLIYIEELADPQTRHCKFWHVGHLVGGVIDVSHAEAAAEGVVEVAWLSRTEIMSRKAFPPMLQGRYWRDRELGFPAIVQVSLRKMEFF
jgi:8-oxo-dGTP diphosphatase